MGITNDTKFYLGQWWNADGPDTALLEPGLVAGEAIDAGEFIYDGADGEYNVCGADEVKVFGHAHETAANNATFVGVRATSGYRRVVAIAPLGEGSMPSEPRGKYYAMDASQRCDVTDTGHDVYRVVEILTAPTATAEGLAIVAIIASTSQVEGKEVA
jgi:hypothetical protein